MTKIHQLRDRVVLIKRRVIEQANGSFKEFWQEGDSVWAQVIPWGGREVYGENWNNFTASALKFKMVLRFRRGRFVRVKWQNMTFALLCPPISDQRRQWMTCWMYVLGEDHE